VGRHRWRPEPSRRLRRLRRRLTPLGPVLFTEPRTRESPVRGVRRMSAIPETRYVKTPDGVHIAYQVVGDGPVDVVFASEWWFHLDAQWEDALVSRFLRRLASFSRLVVFDTRGFGLSDPLPSGEVPTLEKTAGDILAVMDAASVERAAVLAAGDGTPASVLLAATHPERVRALAILNGFARLGVAPDYPD